MSLLELYRYNPDRIPPDELAATFVYREGLLEQILEELKAQAKAKSNQHFLIIGPRGVGKSNFLLMLQQKILYNQPLSEAYLPLKTDEEEYSVTGLLDLFMRIIELATEATNDPVLAGEMKNVREEQNPMAAMEKAIGATKSFCERTGKKLLLLIDNLDLILENQIAEEAQVGRLRDILMNDSFLVLIGSAPTFFKEVSGYNRPLYNFFRVIPLEELTFEGTIELLKKRAAWDENKDLIDRMDEIRPKLQAFFHLTGGNPRLILMLYQLYRMNEFPEVRATMQMLLDDLTPYYKHRMESLAPQQRKVMDIFARLGRPATPTELAGEARLQVNQVNTILKRLRESGFVSTAPQERRKTTLYMVSERVFRIWHQMRFSGQGRRRLEFLVEFLRIWYPEPEWVQEVARLKEGFFTSMESRLAGDAVRFVEHLEYMALAAPRPELGYLVEDETVKMCIDSGDCRRAEEMISERIDKYEREKNPDRLAQAWNLKAYLHGSLGDRMLAIEALKRAVAVKPDMYLAFYNWGFVLADLARTQTGEAREKLFNEAVEKYQKAAAIKPEAHEVFYNWGIALSDLASLQSGKACESIFHEAFEKYQKAVTIKPDNHEAFNNWGNALVKLAGMQSGEAREKRLHEAFEKYQKAVTIKPDTHMAIIGWGIGLYFLSTSVPGSEGPSVLEAAFEKIKAGIRMAESCEAFESVSLYTPVLIGLLLKRSLDAMKLDNRGDMVNSFLVAIEWFPKADPKVLKGLLVGFFRSILREETADLCDRLMKEMDKAGAKDELEVLGPFRAAIRYWVEGKNMEVLDRLNPEVRELVEGIIRGEVPSVHNNNQTSPRP